MKCSKRSRDIQQNIAVLVTGSSQRNASTVYQLDRGLENTLPAFGYHHRHVGSFSRDSVRGNMEGSLSGKRNGSHLFHSQCNPILAQKTIRRVTKNGPEFFNKLF